MSNQDENNKTSSDLPITLYLNQRLTFDLLASLEDGFSKITSAQATSSGETSSKTSGEGKLGFSNVFALVGIEFGGKLSKTIGDQEKESATEEIEIIHTPTSLFSRLRKKLFDEKLVRKISDKSCLRNVIPGDFVEFEATLRKNTIDSFFSFFSSFSGLATLFESVDESNKTNVQRKGKQGSGGHLKQSSGLPQQKEIDAIYSIFKDEKCQDFIAELEDMKVVLATDKVYFIDPTMNDVIDGQFRVFGKVTRVIRENGDTINLLRRSPFGKIIHKLLEAKEEFSKLEELGIGSMNPEIEGPAMQVIPFAIFS